MSAATFVTILAGLVLPACVAGGWWLGGQADLARVTLAGDSVRVVPRGVLRMLSFRREMVLDLALVAGVSVAVCAELPPAGLRSPGLAVPGLRAGIYRCPEATSYWLVGRAARVLRIDLAGGPVDYLLLQVRDPDGMLARIGPRSPLHPA